MENPTGPFTPETDGATVANISPIDSAINDIRAADGTGRPAYPTEVAQGIADDDAEAQAAIEAAAEELRRNTPRLVEPVSIMLDRERHLRLPFWAIRAFEKKAGVSAWDQDKVWGYPPNIDCLIAMVWAACLEEDPSLTIQQVERWDCMTFSNTVYIRRRLDLLWGLTMPDADADAGAGAAGGADPNGGAQSPASTG